MIGTTRSRVSFFMNRFRKLGFINYDGGSGLQVPSALFNIILHDENLAPPRKKGSLLSHRRIIGPRPFRDRGSVLSLRPQIRIGPRAISGWRGLPQWKAPNMKATRRINNIVPSPMPAPPP